MSSTSESTPTGDVLRVRTWDNYVGQDAMKEMLDITIMARRIDGKPLDHILLCGPPGYGKTTLAEIIAAKLTDDFTAVTMPVTEKTFVNLCREFGNGVMLLDEIHAASKAFQEMLLTALLDGYIMTSAGYKLDVSQITFLGATTEPQNVIRPLWDRFILKPEFVDYDEAEMQVIVFDMAARLNLSLPDEITEGMARAAAGTPRIAGALVRAAKDLKIIGRRIDLDSILLQAGVDVDGLTSRHTNYLHTLNQLGGQTGLRNLVTMLQLPLTVVEDLERLLLSRGFVALESSGRCLTPLGRDKLPKPVRTARKPLEMAT